MSKVWEELSKSVHESVGRKINGIKNPKKIQDGVKSTQKNVRSMEVRTKLVFRKWTQHRRTDGEIDRQIDT